MNDKFRDMLLAFMIAFNLLITFTLLIYVLTDKKSNKIECDCPCCICTETEVENDAENRHD